MNAWAEIDLLKAVQREKPSPAKAKRAEAHEDRRRLNLLRRVHELPADLVEAMVRVAIENRRTPGAVDELHADQVSMDWLDEQGLGPGALMRRRPMCTADRAMVLALTDIRMPAGSAAKNFRRQLLEIAYHDGLITHAQAHALRRLVTTFRKQIKPPQLPSYARWLLEDPVVIVPKVAPGGG